MRNFSRPLRMAAAVAGLLGFAGLATQMPVLGSVEAASAWLVTQGVVGAAAFLIVFVLWGLVLPKGPIVAFAGYTYGLQFGLAISYIGATIAIMLAFLIARSFGRSHAKRWLNSRPWLNASNQAISAQGGKIVALLRLSPVVPFHIQNYLYGLSNMSMRTCLFASWLGMLPAMAVSLMLGTSINSAAGSCNWWMAGVGLAATALAATFIARHAGKVLKKNSIS